MAVAFRKLNPIHKKRPQRFFFFKKKSFSQKKMIENDNDKIFHENDTNFNCINFMQTCRKSTFIGTVKVMDILLRLTGNTREILIIIFQELLSH